MERIGLTNGIQSLANRFAFRLEGKLVITEIAFYKIKESLLNNFGYLNNSEVVPIFEKLGYFIDFLPSMANRGDDGIDNALDDYK